MGKEDVTELNPLGFVPIVHPEPTADDLKSLEEMQIAMQAKEDGNG